MSNTGNLIATRAYLYHINRGWLPPVNIGGKTPRFLSGYINSQQLITDLIVEYEFADADKPCLIVSGFENILIDNNQYSQKQNVNIRLMVYDHLPQEIKDGRALVDLETPYAWSGSATAPYNLALDTTEKYKLSSTPIQNVIVRSNKIYVRMRCDKPNVYITFDPLLAETCYEINYALSTGEIIYTDYYTESNGYVVKTFGVEGSPIIQLKNATLKNNTTIIQLLSGSFVSPSVITLENAVTTDETGLTLDGSKYAAAPIYQSPKEINGNITLEPSQAEQLQSFNVALQYVYNGEVLHDQTWTLSVQYGNNAVFENIGMKNGIYPYYTVNEKSVTITDVTKDTTYQCLCNMAKYPVICFDTETDTTLDWTQYYFPLNNSYEGDPPQRENYIFEGDLRGPIHGVYWINGQWNYQGDGEITIQLGQDPSSLLTIYPGQTDISFPVSYGKSRVSYWCLWDGRCLSPHLKYSYNYIKKGLENPSNANPIEIQPSGTMPEEKYVPWPLWAKKNNKWVPAYSITQKGVSEDGQNS